MNPADDGKVLLRAGDKLVISRWFVECLLRATKIGETFIVRVVGVDDHSDGKVLQLENVPEEGARE